MPLENIKGSVLVDKGVIISLLSFIEPSDFTNNSTMYDMGYEQAKREILSILSRGLGKEFNTSQSIRLIRELRGANS